MLFLNVYESVACKVHLEIHSSKIQQAAQSSQGCLRLSFQVPPNIKRKGRVRVLRTTSEVWEVIKTPACLEGIPDSLSSHVQQRDL